jgi:hypothetical protein
MVKPLVLALFFAASTSLTACGGGGSSDCTDPSDPTTCQSADMPIPAPTPLPIGCIDRAILLYPGLEQPTGFSGQIYVSFPANETPGPFLAMQLRLDPSDGHGVFSAPVVGPLQNVTASVPAFVPAPPPQQGWGGIYTSASVQIPTFVGVDVAIIDTRTPAICSPIFTTPGITTIPMAAARRQY